MIEELARHGYKLSPGTLYPMLHAMERKGYLVAREEGRAVRCGDSTELRNWAVRR